MNWSSAFPEALPRPGSPKAPLRRGGPANAGPCYFCPVRILALAIPLTLAPLRAATEDSSRADSAASSPAAPAQETCQELLERIKASDCAKPVSRFLHGASLYAGLAFSGTRMDIDTEDTALATMAGILSPSPAFGFSLPTRYFGGSRWGYVFSLTYASSIAFYQVLRRGGEEVRDLGSYSSITFLAVSPSVFVSVGARDEDPDVWFRTGIGTGAGWASVRGVAYHTQDPSSGRRGCYDAADSLGAGALTRSAFRALCEPRAFKERGLGFSTAFFMDFRWAFLYGRFSAGGMGIASGSRDYRPLEVSIRLAYVHDL